jgi:hypothetical protein
MTSGKIFYAVVVSCTVLAVQPMVALRQSSVFAEEKHIADDAQSWGHVRKLLDNYFDEVEKYSTDQHLDRTNIKAARDTTNAAIKKLRDSLAKLLDKEKLKKVDDFHPNDGTFPPGHQPPPRPPPQIDQFLKELQDEAVKDAGNGPDGEKVKEAFKQTRIDIIDALGNLFKAIGG